MDYRSPLERCYPNEEDGKFHNYLRRDRFNPYNEQSRRYANERESIRSFSSGPQRHSQYPDSHNFHSNASDPRSFESRPLEPRHVYPRPPPITENRHSYTDSCPTGNQGLVGPSTSLLSQNRYGERYKTSTYPRELTNMFEANACKLCDVELQSPIVAKMHYSGKPHHKKIKIYLADWSLRTGRDVPELATSNLTLNQGSGSSLVDFCEVCNIFLPSLTNRLLHYSGKTHKKNERNPDNIKTKKKSYQTIDLSNNFGIGADFSKNKTGDNSTIATQPQSSNVGLFVCTLCGVNAVSEEQLQAHISGKKHKEKEIKAEKKEKDVPNPEKRFVCHLCDVALTTPKLLELHLIGKRHAKALANKGSTGSRYCAVCDLTLPDANFETHIMGKKHEKMSQQKKHVICPKQPGEKASIICKFCPYVGNTDEHVCDRSLANFEHVNLEKKFVCAACNMVFDDESKLDEHKKSRRHLLCTLNREDGDAFIEDLDHWYCNICKKQMHSNKAFTEHLFEPKHMSLSSEQKDWKIVNNLFLCTVCNIQMDGLAKDEHLKDKRHLREALKKDTNHTLRELANADIPTSMYHCLNCDVTSPNFIKYSEHLLGEDHIDRMISARLQAN